MHSRRLERQMKLSTITSRRSMMERDRAMEGARNPGFSKFGDCLVSINSKTDKALTSNLRKINSEIKRMELQINQKMKYFVRNSAVLNHEPMILVERPPSPEIVKRAYTLSHSDGKEDLPWDQDKPGYMKEIRSKARTPSTLTTIDAFTVKSRKKKNVWDGVLEDRTTREFQSTIRPYAKLTKRETSDLQKGYEFHKPKLEELGQSDSEESTKKKSSAKKKAIVEDDDSDLDDMTPFITQMADVRKRKKRVKQEITLADITLGDRTPIRVPSSVTPLDSPLNPEVENSRTVRFSSPIVLSEPGSRQTKRKLKTTATKVVYRR